MKLSTVLLGTLSTVDGGRNWKLLEQEKLFRNRGFVEGGTLKPKRYEGDVSNIREQSREFPFCPSGNPSDDNCYRKCRDVGDACIAEQVFYHTDTEKVLNCRRSTPKHIAKNEVCNKIPPNNAFVNGQIKFNGELLDKHVHKTVEIVAPEDMFIQLTVEDFNIGAHDMEDSGFEEKCGYGGIFIFSGRGKPNQMIRITEFCGTKTTPVVDYLNPAFDNEKGPKFHLGTTAQIQNNRVLIAIMTNHLFTNDTIGNATASISWDIVQPPESVLMRGIDYLTDKISKKWLETACNEVPDLAEYTEGICKKKSTLTKKQTRKHKKFQRYFSKTLQILDKAPRMAHLKCYANGAGPAFLLEPNSQLITDYYTADNSDKLIALVGNLLETLFRECKVNVFWQDKMDKVKITMDKFKSKR